MNSPDVRIIPSTAEWLSSFRDCIDAVAREKKYLMMTRAPSLEKLQNFVLRMKEKDNPQFLAIQGQEVVGWCDLRRLDESEATILPAGELGMGVKKEFRSQGVGRRLLSTCVTTAWDLGFQKIQLKVYQSNQRAIEFYRAAGFHEVAKLQSLALLDGVSQDALLMAKLRSDDET